MLVAQGRAEKQDKAKEERNKAQAEVVQGRRRSRETNKGNGRS